MNIIIFSIVGTINTANLHRDIIQVTSNDVSSTNQSETDSSSSFPVWVIILVIALGIFTVAILVAVIIFVRQRRMQ